MDTPNDDLAYAESRHREIMRSRQARENEMPASVAFDAVLASTDDLSVFVSGLRVFSNGVELTIEVRARNLTPDSRDGLSDGLHGLWHRPLLVGVEFSDGRRGSNIADNPVSGPEDAPMLWSSGGQSGERSASSTLFLSPLPPPGDLQLVCAWPAQGVPDTFTPLPADRILEAAGRVTQLWPFEPEAYEVAEPTYPEIPEGSWFADARRHR